MNKSKPSKRLQPLSVLRFNLFQAGETDQVNTFVKIICIEML